MVKLFTNLFFKQKSTFYALLYLGLIPLFAYFFTLYSNEFYFNSTQYEILVKEKQTAEIQKLIKKYIHESYNYIHRNDSTWIKKRAFITNMNVQNFRLSDDKFCFQVRYLDFENDKAEKIHNKAPYGHEYNTLENWNEVCIKKNKFDVDNLYFITYPELTEEEIKSTRLYQFFPGKNEMIVSDTLDIALKNFKKTIQGCPTSFHDNFWRMFYFSTITITTVGYGDIIPITNRARILVAIEAILGVVTIGLFINSISKDKLKP